MLTALLARQAPVWDRPAPPEYPRRSLNWYLRRALAREAARQQAPVPGAARRQSPVPEAARREAPAIELARRRSPVPETARRAQDRRAVWDLNDRAPHRR